MAATATAQSDAPDTGDSETTSETPQEISYRGRLQDEKGSPISGVFHLKFSLFGSKNASEANWSERRYVAVTDGAYRVPLGAETPLPKGILDKSPYIGVALVGEGEILRDRLHIRSPDVANTSEDEPQGITQETKQLLKQARTNNDLAFADVAERALEADHADVADKVGSLTVDDIKELARSDERAMDRLGKHIADPDAHANRLGGGVGDSQRVMRSVGGSGGADFNVSCPDGYVVTGIQGGSGRVVDRLAIVCSPLK